MPFIRVRYERGRQAARPVLVAVSVALIGAGLMLAGQVAWFLHSSSVHGAALVQRERRAISVSRQATRACQSPGPGHRARAAEGTPRGLLEIPVLGLVAPVLQGTGETVLNDAVGHVPASAWPGQPGTSVLSAHDVTWFSGIGRLRPGDEIRYVMPCHAFSYRVTSHQIVSAGYPVYSTTAGRIVLDTCYPQDALYLTSRRYLVYAGIVRTPVAPLMPASPAGPVPLTVPAPKALAAEGLSLQQNEAPLGVLGLAGSPSPAWRQSNAPLRAEAAALTAYFGIVRSAGQGQRTWWADLAPSVPVAAAAGFWDGEITGYRTPLDVMLRVRGDRVLGATLTATVSSAGSRAPGIYSLAVTETVTRGELLVSGFTARPAG